MHLEDTEEESGGEYAGIVLSQPLEGGNQAEHEHADREPNMGTKLFEEDVGGHFEQDVWNEEDDECSVILRSMQPKILLQTEERGIRDIDTGERRMSTGP
jgi:hypothetical protein